MNKAISQYSDVFVECTEITVPFLSFISALGFISNIFLTRIFIVTDSFDSGSLTLIAYAGKQFLHKYSQTPSKSSLTFNYRN